MKLLKQFDIIIQVLLFMAGCIAAIVYGFEVVIYFYCGLGGWQIVSFLLHLSSQNNLFFRTQRRSYGLTLLWTLGIGILCLPINAILIFLMLLLIVSPCLAIWYISICIGEVKLMNSKDMVHLK